MAEDELGLAALHSFEVVDVDVVAVDAAFFAAFDGFEEGGDDVVGADALEVDDGGADEAVIDAAAVADGGEVAFGELEPGITPRGQSLLQVFREAGWRVDLHENMPGMLWKKFAYIAGSAAVCAAANCVYEEMRSIPETRALIKGAVEEVLAIGRARGAPIVDDSLEWAMNSLDRFPAQGRASLAKDFLAGNRVELEGLTGAVVRMGREVGVPTPINDALYAILKPWAVRIESQLAGG